MTRIAFSVRCSTIALTGAVLIALPAASLAKPDSRPMGGEITVADWAAQVWTAARSGNNSDTFRELDALPAEHDLAAVTSLKAEIDRRDEHLRQAQAEQEKQLQDAWKDLDEKLTKDDLSDSLRTAVEIYTLADDKAGALTNPKIAALVDKAEKAAQSARKEGQWLDAQELLFRLNLLFDTDKRYEKDLDRVSTRLMMIRLYAPERMHDLRNARRVREELDPLPPFNKMGEDWRDKLAGIDDPNMVVRALHHAQLAHVDGADMADLLIGAINNVKTLVTTPDVATTFPGLSDVSKLNQFTSDLDDLTASLETKHGKADAWDLTRTLRSVLQDNADTVDVATPAMLHEFGNGAMSRLDHFSSIVWPDELRQFQKTTQGKFTGVGIQIQLDDAQRLKVVTPLNGTPAQRAGILPGDIITQVDDEPTIGITLTGAVDRITGERGTPVTLTIERTGADKPLVFPLRREDIPIYSVKGWKRNGPHETDWDYMIDPDNHIGYVRVAQFADGVTREFDKAVRSMKKNGLDGLILDLRFNPGGLLNEAVDLSNRFISTGVIVSQHDADGTARDIQKARASSTTLNDIPVVVLINEGSASASEIVSGALQDHHKAVLVGERSYGKGSVQNIYDLGRGLAALRLTIQYYHLPSGRLIHRRPGMTVWGIEPDIHVEMAPEKIGEALKIRQDADVLPIDAQGDVAKGAKTTDPQKLLTDGVDLQLETALVLVSSQAVAKEHGMAMISPTNKVALRNN